MHKNNNQILKIVGLLGSKKLFIIENKNDICLRWIKLIVYFFFAILGKSKSCEHGQETNMKYFVITLF